MPDELRQLVRQCLAGQMAAHSALMDRYQGQVFGFCFRMLGHRQDAEDCAQETMLRVLNNLHRWDPTRKFEPWLFTIAGNRCRTRLAQRKRRPNHQTLEVPVEDRSQEKRDAELLAEEIEHALCELRPEYAVVFRKFHHQEKSYEEIANELAVPLGTVKTWVHRARREIAQKLVYREVLATREAQVESQSELRTIRKPNPVPAG